jgi:catechol 2,3-dioxygenase-like lactoylglutathione lyase family enzyme
MRLLRRVFCTRTLRNDANETAIGVEVTRLIDRIFHVNIVVRDLDRALDFYTNALGAHIVDGPHSGEGAPMLGISHGAPMWGVDPNEVKVRFAFLRFGGQDDEPILDILEFVQPRSWGAPYPTLQNIGIARIALRVDDVQRTYDELLKKGVKFLTPPVPVEIGENYLAGIAYCCFFDPDGAILEIYGPLHGNRDADTGQTVADRS